MLSCNQSASNQQKTINTNNASNSLEWNNAKNAPTVFVLNNSSFRIFPNPARDVLHIEFPEHLDQMEFEVRLYNAMGQVVYDGSNERSILVDGFVSGVYFVEVRGLDGFFGFEACLILGD